MVEKLDRNVVDPIIQKDFIQDLKDNRFGLPEFKRKDDLWREGWEPKSR